MLTYNEAKKLFDSARNKDAGKPLENNTRLMKRGDSYAIRLHRTDIVLIHADGSYTLNTGGWNTRTTKDRLNSYSPVKVYSNKRVLHVHRWNEQTESMDRVCEFFDGIRLDSNGLPVMGAFAAREAA
jgi:hypothetical protein